MTQRGQGSAQKFVRELLSSPPTEECIEWPFSTRSGYGQINVEHHPTPASRYVLILHTGEAPDGMLACHGPCHNTLCVNPLHLYWGSQADNMQDTIRDGTRTHTRGSKNGSSKIDEKTALAIFHDRRTQHQIAHHYDISRSTVAAIKVGARWSWLTTT